MSGLARWLEGIWYRPSTPPWPLRALSALYRAALRARRSLYALGWKRTERVGVPVVVVGNITVGGTGKTPLTIALADDLARRGWNPGVVLRGYGGRVRAATRVTARSTPEDVGDEAVLIARATGLPVAIGRARVDAARLLVRDAGCRVIVSDDGLQHWAMARDVEIAVVDGTRRLGNGHLLPAGPLREPADRLARVDFVVCNGTPREGEVGMTVRGARARSLTTGQTHALADWRGRTVHAVAGIGNPERFFVMLEGLGLNVVRHALDDHHRYDGAELRYDDTHPVLITDKDAVKCADHANERVYVVPVEAQVDETFYQRVHQHLHAGRGDQP
jgi:tetraacyldisaccharide 4'-kinase